MKTAFITGVTGQDGAYLAKFLLDKGYRVVGLVPQRSTSSFWRLDYFNITDSIELVYGDVTDLSSLVKILRTFKPDEVYNLAAQSFVGVSWDQPILTCNVTGMGALNVLEAVRLTDNNIKVYQASSSEMFGEVQEPIQNENTPFYPRSPYGVSKLFAHWMTVNYRESHDMFASSGILFNHESPLRGLSFVTRKVTDAVARISLGVQDKLILGNLNAKRDWGFAGDYVEAMWLMLQHDKPDTFVVSTGLSHSIKDLCDVAFNYVGLNWKEHVESNASLFRPAEVNILMGNSDKAKETLGWVPKTSFKEMVEMMIEADMKRVEKEIAKGHM
ncbi:GDP-mannose 4,6-dehydratase [Bacillus weihaiensis]|uniref:GDP-mannose 4,6-dehydratase n=1 Tax=Bacillus weihaiensis TaxID=1547283 RepID=A0A1L3MW82_9BACI|nr:GDP-mannose 4,6-dehydratase [Bacillus weihaiensis]APH06593.1 GDP-mannose 4,6-dehydratase [Bacillus weihaiensis]